MAISEPSNRSRKGCRHGFPIPPLPLPADLRVLRKLPQEHETVVAELWLAVRRFRDWLQTPPDRRVRLLIDTSVRSSADRLYDAYSEAGALASALAAIVPLSTHMIAPDTTVLAQAYRQIAEWAEFHGLLELGILFADAVTALTPADPCAVSIAARLSRDAGYLRRAEILFQRGVGLANVVADDEAKARAYLGWGTLHFRLGDFESARRFYNRAGNLLRKGGSKSLAGEVFHDIMLMSIEAGSFDDAQKYAHRAFRWYPVHHERIPRAVHDFALLLVWQSFYAPAIPLLEKVVHHVEPIADRVMIWSTLARAAGGARDLRRFTELRDRILDLIANYDRYAPACLINLSFGAHALGQTGEAINLATKGLQLAQQRTTCKVEERAAVQLLNALANGVAPPPPRPLPTPAAAREGTSLSELITHSGRLIQRWHGPTWRRKDQDGSEKRGRI